MVLLMHDFVAGKGKNVRAEIFMIDKIDESVTKKN